MSEMDLFASMGLDNVEADPNFIADGRYPAYLTQSEIITPQKGKNAGKPQWAATYRIESGQFSGKQQSEYFPVGPTAREDSKPYLKRRLLSLGVPEAKIGEFQPSDVVGTAVWVSIKHNNGYQNVANVELRGSGDTVSSSTPATPTSSSSSVPQTAGKL